MTHKTDLVEVKIKQQVLWIGSDAYPLRNVTATRRAVIVPDRLNAVKSFLKSLLVLFVLLIIAMTVGESVSDTLTELATSFAMVLFVVLFIVLVKRLRTPELYELIIETASSAQTVVASPNFMRVSALDKQVMEAINNPQAEFQLQIENAHIGDRITQHGNRNVGKQVG
ncbi:DUF6232 family protein [Streptomyces sp. KM273126]|uniref:DUF6232 family protein n=1 Tax=Streptomyces sp. KM273126 TaxID=2545247 RepID=UPI00215D8BC3|nr:DUF6232 family protein [Streptomyces sp. KM273126]